MKLLPRIDPTMVDQWGIPVLRFHWKWSDNELKMAKDMQETYREIVETAGRSSQCRLRSQATVILMGICGRRRHHPRSWHRAHGRTSCNFRVEWLLPGSRCQDLFVTDGALL